MTFKLLQLNIWRGRFIKNIIDYINRENFDICTFQEVTSKIPDYEVQVDCYSVLEKSLPLKGVLQKNLAFEENPGSYLGVATFYSNKMNLLKKETVELKPYAIIPRYPDSTLPWESIPNSALLTQFTIQNHRLTVINLHGAWSKNPNDTPEKIRQGKILYERCKQITSPLIFSGDFNVKPDTLTLKNYEQITLNLTSKFNLTNTLNPRIHKAKHLFPAGIAADHVFISREIKIKSYRAIEELDLSDHLGISMEFEL